MAKKTKSKKSQKERGVCCHYPGERAPRFIEPFLLLVLSGGPSHGYVILRKLREMGLKYESSDIGYVYRNLRKMERSGYVTSQWSLKRVGPSRRIYHLTPRGEERLHEWIDSIKLIRRNLGLFLKKCKEIKKTAGRA